MADLATLTHRLENLIIENKPNQNGKKKRNRNRKRRSNDMFGVKAMQLDAPAAGTVVVSRNLAPNLSTRGNITMVCNSELISLIGGLASTRIPLAPFQTTWLNGVASSYSKWRWHKLRLIYVPSCSSSTAGTIVFGLGYDYQDSLPPSIGQATQSFHSVTTVPWAGYNGAYLLNDDAFVKPGPGTVALDLDVNRQTQPWYTYCTAATFPATAADRNQYAPAYLDVTLSGPAVTGFGSLFIKYEALLIEPIAFIDNQ